MVGLMRIAHAESPRVLPEIDAIYARDQFIGLIGNAMSWVAYDGDSLVGGIVCATVSYSWNPRPCGIELHYLYILPAYRKMRIIAEVIQRVQRMCDQGWLTLQSRQRIIGAG